VLVLVLAAVWQLLPLIPVLQLNFAAVEDCLLSLDQCLDGVQQPLDRTWSNLWDPAQLHPAAPRQLLATRRLPPMQTSTTADYQNLRLQLLHDGCVLQLLPLAPALSRNGSANYFWIGLAQ